jgi:hypothetical protein
LPPTIGLFDNSRRVRAFAWFGEIETREYHLDKFACAPSLCRVPAARTFTPALIHESIRREQAHTHTHTHRHTQSINQR